MHQEREYPGRVVATELHNPDFVAYALAFGGYGAVVEKTADFPAAFAAARASGKPSIIHLKIDPEAITPTATLTGIREKVAGGRRREKKYEALVPTGLAHAAPLNHRSLVPCPIAAPRTWSAGLPSASRRSSMPQRSIAGEGGMGAVQIAAVAAARRHRRRHGLPLLSLQDRSRRRADCGRCRVASSPPCVRPADAAPGPLSALAACIATFAARALHERRLAWAVMAEPVDADIDALRLDFRRALAAELEMRIRTAIAGGHLPDQDAGVAAPADRRRAAGRAARAAGAANRTDAGARARRYRAITLFALRALGVVDARARGPRRAMRAAVTTFQ